jgi:predicted small lipoprotein YifL
MGTGRIQLIIGVLLAILVIGPLLSGCGAKGDLFLPDPDKLPEKDRETTR